MAGGNSRDRRKFKRGVLEALKRHKVELGIEFCIGVLIALYQLGAEQMEIPHSFWVGLGCWLIAGVIVVRIFWVIVDYWPAPARAVLCLFPLCVFGWLAWDLAYPKYKEQFTLTEAAKSPPTIPTRIVPRPPSIAFERTPTRHPVLKVAKRMDPEVREEVAKQMVRLADRLTDFANDCRAIEKSLPVIDPNLPLGVGKHKYDNNLPAQKWDGYHTKTQWAFGKETYAPKCRHIIASLPDGLPEDDVSTLKAYCRDYPSYPNDASSLDFLSSLLSKMAREIELMPN